MSEGELVCEAFTLGHDKLSTVSVGGGGRLGPRALFGYLMILIFPHLKLIHPYWNMAAG